MTELAADDPLMIGEFRVRMPLGQGGMGRVYLGLSPAGRAVAVKVLHPELARDDAFLRRFEREIAAARAVSGICTAPVVGAGLDERPPWLATAFVPGPSLQQLVRDHGVLPEPTLWSLFAGLVEALREIHEAGVVHRDLKPSNVLLAMDGPRVIDFGISWAAGGTKLTASGTVFSSPCYMSPEQAEGKATGPAADLFSLGSLMVYAAAGAPPFGQGNAASVLYRVVHDAPALETLPPRLREIVARCLAKDPADRPTLISLAAQIDAGIGGMEPRGLSFWPLPVTGHIKRFQASLETELGAVAAQADEASETAAVRTVRADVPAYPEPPATIRGAAGIMYAGAAYALVFAAFSWLIAAVHPGSPLVVWQGHWRIRGLAGLTVLGVADCCIQVPLWLWLARACQHAKGWARTAGLVLFAGYTVASGYALVMHTRDRVDTLGTALFALTWVIGAAALALLWLRPSRAYLEGRR
ncbi:MAG TPA: serine/threonine-protein kinase [Streptosporangiaceae bacterium]